MPQIVKFGSNRDNDPKCNIVHGLLEIPGYASTIKPSQQLSDAAILFQGKLLLNGLLHLYSVLSMLFFNRKKQGSVFQSVEHLALFCAWCLLKCFQHVVMVGGFACSEWLCERVKRCLTPLGLNVFRSETHVLVILFVF